MQIFIWRFILLVGNVSGLGAVKTPRSSDSKWLGCMQHSNLISCLYGDLVQVTEPLKCDSKEDKNATSSTNEESEPFEMEQRDCSPSAIDIAEKAAQVAQAANDAQDSAAQDAEKQVRMQLAHKAMQAARAVQAILEGKQVIVDNYEREIREADAFVCQLDSDLKRGAENAAKVHAMAKRYECQLSNLEQLMQQATASMRDAQNLQELAETDLKEKTQRLETLRNYVNDLDRQVAQAPMVDGCVKEAEAEADEASPIA